MKKLFGIISIIVVIIALLAAGCSRLSYTAGSGPLIEKTFDFKDFSTVEISSAIKYQIRHTDEYSITVSTYENVMKHLDVHQFGKTLVVRLDPGHFTNSEIEASITLPDIDELNVSGASHGSISGFKFSHDFKMGISGASQGVLDMESGDTEIEISGASNMEGALKAASLRLEVTGASRCTLEGTAENADIEASGASHIEGKNFNITNTNINLSGASKGDIYTSGQLSLDISGASTLIYYGKPDLKQVNVSGASKITAK
jgi:hypothetical protein